MVIGRFGWALGGMLLLISATMGNAQTFYDNEYIWSNSDPTLNVRRSEHFRLIWGNGQNSGTSSEYNSVTEQLIQGNLQAFEHSWHLLFDAQPGGLVGFRAPNESNNPAYRDGRYYRTNLTLNNAGIYEGGGWGTMDSYGFPWFAVNPAGLRYDPSPDASLHEFIHTVFINAGGFNNTPWDGQWHESTVDWLGVFSYWYAGMGNYSMFHNFSLPNGRCHYDSWLFPELLYEDPRYGTQFLTKVWTQANGGSGEYMFDAMIRLHPAGEPDPTNAIKDCLGSMAARNVTWDYLGKQYYRLTTSYTIDSSPFNERMRRGTTELVLQPGSTTWYRVPFEHAPCQGGYDICPIQLIGKTVGVGGYPVSVDFQPLWDSVRKSDWRACFVAVNGAGDARYSNLWNSGINTITLSADENKLYLVVAATPDFQAYNGFGGPLMTDAPTSPQAYRVAFVNTSARPYLVTNGGGGTGWHQHANGNGWVKDSATVDATAYVGPNALVYDTAQVRNYARVEDYAQVLSTAQVRDNAIVSGHAVVKDSTQVYGYAKVRDWATVNDHAKVYENGKVLEHGYVSSTVQVHGDAVIKGCAMDFDDANNYGCAMKDADCSNYADMDHGVLMGWVWGTDQNRANVLTDNAYLYCGYDFDRTSPNYALDKYGITYGYLMGGPTIVDGGATNRHSVLSLNGSTQYVELHRDVSDFDDCSIAVWVKWTGGGADQKVFSFGDGANKYVTLTPSDASGNLKFAITTTGAGGEQTLTSTAVPINTWTHIAVTLSGNTGALYVNGTPVATNTSMTLNPDDCNGPNTAAADNCNYIGKGSSGNYFNGQIDEFRVYSKALTGADITALQTLAGGTVTTTTDTTAPTPNPAAWLVAPKTVSATAVTMSATRGSDASNYIEYLLTCTSGGGHDSGWISANRYFDSGLTPGTTYTYTVRMRDKAGNMTATSTPMSVTPAADTDPPTPNAATFLLPPKGISTTAIKMTATTGTDASALVEYKFDRVSPTTANSGWQSSPIWTDTSLTSGVTYGYTVQMKDAYGNTGTVSGVSTAVARDDTPPTRYAYGEWSTLPYATIDNRIAMRARSVHAGEILSCDIAGESVQYYFHCTSGGGPDSGWVDSNIWQSAALADGTYSYQFKIRDKSSRLNETPYSSIETGVVGPTTGYHTCTFAQAFTLPDEYLVTFTGVVMRVNSDNYLVRDMASGSNITVKPHLATSAANVLKNCTIQGHLLTLGGTRIVTTATVSSPTTPTSYTISGRVTSTSGAGISGATVYFSDAPNASVNPVTTVPADTNGYYSKAVPNPSIWYVAAGSGAYNTSADQIVSVNGANVGNINFTLVANAKVYGKVTRKSDGTAISGAAVYFSTSPGASSSPVYTASTDSSGNYNRSLQNGTWYVCASATGFWTSPDQTVVISGADVTGIGFALKPNTRNIPRTSDLLFSAVTETFPSSGSTGNWATYLPSGQTLTMIATPTVDTIGGIKWEKNTYSEGDGYLFGSEYTSSIPCVGASIVIAVKPVRCTSNHDWDWRSAVDIFYDRLVLGVRNWDGKVCVRRNGSNDASSTAIPDGQLTILSLVVQSDGKYKVYANGSQLMNITSTSTMTSLVPGVAGAYANYINVGRNNPDGWTVFNGDIGDVFVYKIALSDAERQQLEADLSNKFRGLTISASANAGGTISPSGLVCLNSGDSQTFTITPASGYVILDVKADGVSKGTISTWTFTNVTANHTISATFAKAVGVNNKAALTDVKLVGKAVKVWGTVKSVNGTTSFIMSDGYTTDITVNVNGATLPTGFGTGKMAVVTGILAADKTVQAQDIKTP